MDPDCLFCKIVAGEIPATRVYESEQVIGFNDISPQAPIHVLFIPREHISTINDANPAARGCAWRIDAGRQQGRHRPRCRR